MGMRIGVEWGDEKSGQSRTRVQTRYVYANIPHASYTRNDVTDLLKDSFRIMALWRGLQKSVGGKHIARL